MRKRALFGIVCLALIGGAYIFGVSSGKRAVLKGLRPQVDTLLIHDTITASKPPKIDERVVGVEYILLTDRSVEDSLRFVADSLALENGRLEHRADSLFLALERTQAHYGDSLYDVWVSGYRPALDSIKLYVPQTIITQTIRESVPCKWGVGVQMGAGITRQGLSPYVGVGVSYNLFSW